MTTRDSRILIKPATPIVMVTAADTEDPNLIFRAMQTGVLESCKLPSPTHPDYETRRVRLIRSLRTLAGVPMIHRSPSRARRKAVPPPACRVSRLNCMHLPGNGYPPTGGEGA